MLSRHADFVLHGRSTFANLAAALIATVAVEMLARSAKIVKYLGNFFIAANRSTGKHPPGDSNAVNRRLGKNRPTRRGTIAPGIAIAHGAALRTKVAVFLLNPGTKFLLHIFILPIYGRHRSGAR